MTCTALEKETLLSWVEFVGIVSKKWLGRVLESTSPGSTRKGWPRIASNRLMMRYLYRLIYQMTLQRRRHHA